MKKLTNIKKDKKVRWFKPNEIDKYVFITSEEISNNKVSIHSYQKDVLVGKDKIINHSKVDISELYDLFVITDELVKLANDKGFIPKTVTTKWVEQRFIGKKIKSFLNDNCYISYLEEVKIWLIENFDIHILVNPLIAISGKTYTYEIIGKYDGIVDDIKYDFLSYENALENALLKTLNYMK